jgi:hypothetical protein
MGDGYLDYLGQAGAMRDGTGGWHDAGDFGKYTGNAGFTLGMMLSAFERHPAGILQAPLPIPEAGGALPDYLDELRWELDWMLKMIYADDDGRVSHKLTARAFEGFVMPEADTQTRYFVPFATAATADFVAALAQASRIYRPYDEAFADRCLTAARTAYAYLTANAANTPARPDRLHHRRLHDVGSRRPVVGRRRDVGDHRRRRPRWPTSRRGFNAVAATARWSPPTSTGDRCGTWVCSRICCRRARGAHRRWSIACGPARSPPPTPWRPRTTPAATAAASPATTGDRTDRSRARRCCWPSRTA